MTEAHEQAFPSDDTAYGLTKREYFAALAMQGLLTSSLDESQINVAPRLIGEVVAEYAVGYADALIAELNGEKQ